MLSESDWRDLISREMASGSRTVSAHTYRRIKFQSFSCPVVLGCDDGDDYVVKALGKQPALHRALFNDLTIGLSGWHKPGFFFRPRTFFSKWTWMDDTSIKRPTAGSTRSRHLQCLPIQPGGAERRTPAANDPRPGQDCCGGGCLPRRMGGVNKRTRAASNLPGDSQE